MRIGTVRVAYLIGLCLVGIPGGAGSVFANEKGFAPEVDQILSENLSLIGRLAQEASLVEAVRASNVAHRELGITEILNRDQRWRSASGIDEFIQPFLVNECAQKLIDFQESNDEFPEVFVTDSQGLIVGTTNKTSDYYQADEDWWVQAYDEGRGKSYYGEIEYDESAFAQAIALYVPIRDPETDQAIGVMKAILDLTAIMMRL